MKTIAERIYLGETAEQIGVSQMEYGSRQRLVQAFAQTWQNEGEFGSAYQKWISARAEGQRGRPAEITATTASTSQSGLGDTVAAITQATGLDKLAYLYTKITGKDCGCKRRQATLNRLFPYGRK